MADKAHINSLDAIDAFRTALLLYVNKARPALEEVSSDVLRTKVWLESEQRIYWESQLRLRLRTLEQAQQALFSSRISNFKEESPLEVMAVHRAKREVEEAEAKLRVLRRWNREFESRVQPLVKELEKFHSVLSMDLPKAAAYLTEVLKTLTAYADKTAPASVATTPAPPPPPPSETAEIKPGGGG